MAKGKEKVIKLNHTPENILKFLELMETRTKEACVKGDEEIDEWLPDMVEDIHTLCRVVIDALDGDEAPEEPAPDPRMADFFLRLKPGGPKS